MKIILSLCLLVLIFNGQVFARGQTGHRAVRTTAQRHLNKKVRKAAKQINNRLNYDCLFEDIKLDTIVSIIRKTPGLMSRITKFKEMSG